MFSEPAPEGGGLAKSFCKVINPGIVAIYFFLITALLIGLKRIDFLVSYFITIGLVYGEMVYFKKKLGGITGDQIGLVVELFQIFFIFISLMIVKVW